MNRAKKKLSAFDIIMIVVAILAIALIIAGACLLKSCLSRSSFEDEVVIGDFICQEWGKDEIHIKAFTESAQSKKHIIIPAELNGRRVVAFGYVTGLMGQYKSNIKSENLEKMFLMTSRINTKSGALYSCEKLNKILVINNGFDDTSKLINSGYTIFLSSMHIRNINMVSQQNNTPYLYIANVSYYYNYEGSENDGYYWIDDIENGEKIEVIPEEPKREGYKFVGWYKEQECINKWDFEKDTIIKAEYHEKFIENKLYAKWINV